jgi:hypothetical protein
MDLDHFIQNFSKAENIGKSIGLYIIASQNLSPKYQSQNFCRCGVAGSKEVANIDISVTASGNDSKKSSLVSRAAMYLSNNIQSMKIIACLTLPSSVINSPSGPTISRLLEMRKDGDNRPNYALKGKTQALVLESIFHATLDSSQKVSRARRQTEWFKTEQPDFKNIKLALINVGIGVFYDFTKFSPTALPDDFIDKGILLKSRMPLKTTSHLFKTLPRLKELQNNFQANNEVSDKKDNISLSSDDLEDIRSKTKRGHYLIGLITLKQTQNTQTKIKQRKPFE